MKHKLICLFLALIVLLSLTACAEEKKPSYTVLGKDETYVNTDRLDAQNYSMYVNKELALLTNILEAHMATAEHIKSNTSMISEEILTLDEDLVKVEEAIETIRGIYPPKKYDDDRLMFLRRMENAKQVLVDYQSDLKIASAVPEDNVKLLTDHISAMQLSFTELKSSFNNWTE